MFQPTYKDWPAPHRTLSALLPCFALVVLLGYGLHLRPRQAAIDRRKAAVEEKSRRFAELNLPLDTILLQDQLNASEWLLQGSGTEDSEKGLQAKTDMLLRNATRAFTRKIQESYDDTLAFIYGATRLDYKELQGRILSTYGPLEPSLSAEALEIAPGENAAEPPVWQMIGRLWAIQELLEKSSAAGLHLSTAQEGVLQELVAEAPLAYTTEKTPEGAIFLLEFPVRATFTGTLEQFRSFVSSLQTGDTFLPMKKMAICTRPPETLVPGDENRVDQCDFRVQCCAFMMPQGIDPQSLPEESSSPEDSRQ